MKYLFICLLLLLAFSCSKNETSLPLPTLKEQLSGKWRLSTSQHWHFLFSDHVIYYWQENAGKNENVQY